MTNESTKSPAGVLGAKVDMFGLLGARHYDLALKAAHQFAQATRCPAGGNVFLWLNTQAEELLARETALRQASIRGGEA